jgi:uncharacterized membrane protein YozB (DUF420 family)
MHATHVASALVLVVIATGLWFRKRRPVVHRALMIAAFAADLSLVIYIEVTRHAVEKVVSRVQAVLWLHAAISLAVLACYTAMIRLGWRLRQGEEKARPSHRVLGIAFLVFRTLNFVTSFLVG